MCGCFLSYCKPDKKVVIKSNLGIIKIDNIQNFVYNPIGNVASSVKGISEIKKVII